MRKTKPKVDTVTLTLNEELEGIELRFPGTPDAPVRALMKERKWRFNADKWKDPRWYIKNTPEELEWATNLVTILNGQTPAAEPVEEPAQETAPEEQPEPQLEAPEEVETVTVRTPSFAFSGGSRGGSFF
jgi:hypothetical protein